MRASNTISALANCEQPSVDTECSETEDILCLASCVCVFEELSVMLCVAGACGSFPEGDSDGADGWRQRAGHRDLHRGVLCAAAAVHCGYVSPHTSLIRQHRCSSVQTLR